MCALTLGPIAEKRRTRRARPKPTQLDLPLDLAAAMAASIARFAVPSEGPIQSPAAAAITEMVQAAQQARSDLERKITRRKKVTR